MGNDLVGILLVDVYRASELKAGEKNSSIEATFRAYHDTLNNEFDRCDGERWHSMGDGAIFKFPDSPDAVAGALRLLDQLTRFDSADNRLASSLHVRIGISECPRDELEGIPVAQRGELASRSLDLAGHLEKKCPPGKIAISRQVYSRLQNVQQGLFREPAVGPLDREPAFVLEQRNTMPRERLLAKGLTDDQLRRLPPMPFRDWRNLQPDHGLKGIHSILSEPLLVVLGESSAEPSGAVQPAATSDAVGAIEIMAAIRSNTSVTAGMDRWADTADVACERSIVIVGSGVVNTYAFAFNDLVKSVCFAKAEGRVVDQLIANTLDGRRLYGSHADSPRDCGIVVIFRSPVNPGKHVLWIAGITGMGTQAAAKLAWDVVNDPEATMRERLGANNFDPIACVVSASTSSGSSDVTSLYKRWRIADYNLLLAIDREGRFIAANDNAD